MRSLSGSRALLQKARDAGATRILVGLSGGKDSLVVTDLCVSVFGQENVEAFSMYIVKDLRCCETPVRYAENRWKLKVHRVPHWSLGAKHKHAVFMPVRRQALGWRDMKMVDVEALVKKMSGIEWLAYGHRMDESLERRAMLHSYGELYGQGGLNLAQKRAYPLWDWKARDVFSYMGARRIPRPPSFGITNASGLNFRLPTLKWLRANYPDDLEKLKVIYPFLDAAFKREEFFGGEKEEAK